MLTSKLGAFRGLSWGMFTYISRGIVQNSLIFRRIGMTVTRVAERRCLGVQVEVELNKA